MYVRNTSDRLHFWSLFELCDDDLVSHLLFKILRGGWVELKLVKLGLLKTRHLSFYLSREAQFGQELISVRNSQTSYRIKVW